MTADERAGGEGSQDAHSAQDAHNAHNALDERDPVWESTDWTEWQRKWAIVGQLLIAAACGLLVWSLTHWWSHQLVATISAPIAMTLLCLGIGLLNAAYWYRYQHATNAVGLRAERMGLLAGLMKLAIVVALGTLAVQVGDTVVVVLAGQSAVQGLNLFYAYAVPVAVGFLSFGMGLMMASGLAWRPTRAPNAPETAADNVTTSPRGVFLLLRWFVLLLATRGGLVIVVPAVLLFYGELDIVDGSHLPFVEPGVITDLGVVALFFLLTGLIEVALWVRERGRAEL